MLDIHHVVGDTAERGQLAAVTSAPREGVDDSAAGAPGNLPNSFAPNVAKIGQAALYVRETPLPSLLLELAFTFVKVTKDATWSAVLVGANYCTSPVMCAAIGGLLVVLVNSLPCNPSAWAKKSSEIAMINGSLTGDRGTCRGMRPCSCVP